MNEREIVSVHAALLGSLVVEGMCVDVDSINLPGLAVVGSGKPRRVGLVETEGLAEGVIGGVEYDGRTRVLCE